MEAKVIRFPLERRLEKIAAEKREGADPYPFFGVRIRPETSAWVWTCSGGTDGSFRIGEPAPR